MLTRALTRFRFPWRWDGEPAVIQSRAIDETGYVQPTLAELLAVRGDNHFYHNNAIWPWRIACRRRGQQCAGLRLRIALLAVRYRCVRVRARKRQKHLWHRPPRDAGGDRGLEHRHRPRRLEPAAGQRQRRARPRRVRGSNAPPATAIRARAASAIGWSAGRARSRRAKPVRTVGSYWPYAPTLFDYIRRAMPQNAPQSLSNDDVYAVSAYILNLNGLVPAEATLDAKTLAAIRMPNRNDFVPDPRPDVK